MKPLHGFDNTRESSPGSVVFPTSVSGREQIQWPEYMHRDNRDLTEDMENPPAVDKRPA